jgi:hypothetical protein
MRRSAAELSSGLATRISTAAMYFMRSAGTVPLARRALRGRMRLKGLGLWKALRCIG